MVHPRLKIRPLVRCKNYGRALILGESDLWERHGSSITRVRPKGNLKSLSAKFMRVSGESTQPQVSMRETSPFPSLIDKETIAKKGALDNPLPWDKIHELATRPFIWKMSRLTSYPRTSATKQDGGTDPNFVAIMLSIEEFKNR